MTPLKVTKMKSNANSNGLQKMDRADVHQARIWRRRGKTYAWIAKQFGVSSNAVVDRITGHPLSSCRAAGLDWEVTWQRVLAAHIKKLKESAK